MKFTANGSDPDGDPISYEWSGCASGTGSSGNCVVDAIKGFTATVTVSDGKGGTDSASGFASGVNVTPHIDGAGGCGAGDNIDITWGVTDDDNPSANKCQVNKGCAGGCSISSYAKACYWASGTLNGPAGCYCTLTLTVTDPWGEVSNSGDCTVSK